MMFKNTIRLAFSNFTNTWKILFYKVVVILCILGLTSVAGWHIINTLINNGFFAEVKSALSSILFNVSFVNLYNACAYLLKLLLQILTKNSLMVEACLILGGFLVAFYYVSGLSSLAVTNVVSSYMSSCARFGFSNTFVACLSKSMFVQVFRTIILLPATIGILLLSLLIYQSLMSVSIILSLFVTTLTVIVLFSISLTLFSGWLPALAVHDCNVFAGFTKGFKAVLRRFWRTFSTSLVVVICLLAINLFALSFTYGVGLIITLPLSELVLIIFSLTMYYGSNGMRYYTDSNTIVDTKKLEQQDSVFKAKNII